ncbi:hypothetical protein BC332_28858 [Capsicum chinense]|nr:hypothetical protein BC332_28858 [Capsicum chinense]
MSNELSKILQKQNEDIVNAVKFLNISKKRLQDMRDNGWESLLDDVSSFCDSHASSDLLLGMGNLNPVNSFSNFDKDKIMILAKCYPNKFDDGKLQDLSYQLDTFIIHMQRRNFKFSNLQGIRDLAKALVEANLVETYSLIYLLVKLALILAVATATIERAFSSMKHIKNEVRNSIGDQYLNDCLVCYTKRDVFANMFADTKPSSKELIIGQNQALITCAFLYFYSLYINSVAWNIFQSRKIDPKKKERVQEALNYYYSIESDVAVFVSLSINLMVTAVLAKGFYGTTQADRAISSRKLDELLSDNILEESLDKESIISGTSFCYDDSESTCSHTELDIDECVEAPEDTSFYSLGVAFILYGEITEKQEDQCDSCQADDETETMNYQAEVKAEETFCVKKMKFQLRTRNVQLLTMVMQLQDNERNSDENIVVEMEDTRTNLDCCEQGNENDHGDDDKQLVVDVDLKCKTREDYTSHQAEDETENIPGAKADPTAEACAEKLNQIKDATRFKDKKTHAKYEPSDELSESYRKLRGIARRSDTKEPEESREFNPRPPNFLPLEPEPDAEKVDLKHQMMDDRKNAEDWMLDFALRRVVDKLAPARKRKVALLVEAFETVIPTSKWEPHLRRSAAGFAHPRPIQACN